MILLFVLALTANSQGQDAMRMPPPTILSRAWMVLANEGPIGTDKFCTASTTWTDGAYYLRIHSEGQGKWKLMLIPPQGGMDWQIKVLQSKKERIKGDEQADQSQKRRVVAWSHSFARAIRNFPPPFDGASTFKVRAIPEENRVVYFLEKDAPPAWVTFTTEESGKIKILDSGF